MKKVAVLVMSALIVSSLSGCTNRNTGYRNQNYGMNRGINQGTTQGIRTGYGIGNMGTTQGAYRDGIYTGNGDRRGSYNQTATVYISGGRITDITLRTVDAQGRDVLGTTRAGTTTGTTTGITTGGTGTTAITPGTRFYGTPGVTTGGANAGMSGNITGTPRGNTGTLDNYGFGNTGTNTGWTTGNAGTTAGYGLGSTVGGTGAAGYGTITDGTGSSWNAGSGWNIGGTGAAGNITGTTGTTTGTTGNRTGNTTGVTGGTNTGRTTGGTGPAYGLSNIYGTRNLDTIRRQIASAMISQQNADIALGTIDTPEARNWKLAVRRALDQARIGVTTGGTRTGVSGGAGGTGGTTR